MSSTSRGRLISRLTAGTAGQLFAGIGALAVLLSPFGLPLAGAGVALMLLGVVISAPEAGNGGPYLEQWWTPMSLASLVCLVGFALELVIPAVGGLLLTVGGVAALLAVGLGMPPRPGRE